jgi:bifunctional non-homologous end joining protein LigD
MSSLAKVQFIEPMLLLRKETLPVSESWLYELKLDGFRAIAYQTGGTVHLRSLNDKDFNTKYSAIAKALAPMPDETVIGGEIVVLDRVDGPHSTPSRTTVPPRCWVGRFATATIVHDTEFSVS